MWIRNSLKINLIRRIICGWEENSLYKRPSNYEGLCLEQCPVRGSCEHGGNKHFGFTKVGQFNKWLATISFLRRTLFHKFITVHLTVVPVNTKKALRRVNVQLHSSVNRDTMWWWVANLTPRSFYSRGRATDIHSIGGCRLYYRKCMQKTSTCISLLYIMSYASYITWDTDMRRLTTGIRSEKRVVRRFRRGANMYLHKPRSYSLLYTKAMWYSLLLLGYKPLQQVTVLNIVRNFDTMVL